MVVKAVYWKAKGGGGEVGVPIRDGNKPSKIEGSTQEKKEAVGMGWRK